MVKEATMVKLQGSVFCSRNSMHINCFYYNPCRVQRKLLLEKINHENLEIKTGEHVETSARLDQSVFLRVQARIKTEAAEIIACQHDQSSN